MAERVTLEAVNAAIAFSQPRLSAEIDGENILIKGKFLVFEPGIVCKAEGPITDFDVKIMVPKEFPEWEPTVFEVGDKIPRSEDHHVNPDGDCCITVWEYWLATTDSISLEAYIDGPINSYFLAQYWYMSQGEWPFGEWKHGSEGLVDAYTEILGIPKDRKRLHYQLKLLSQDWPKGHWLCPCGSGMRLRHCHRGEMMDLHKRVPSSLARKMLGRLIQQQGYPQQTSR